MVYTAFMYFHGTTRNLEPETVLIGGVEELASLYLTHDQFSLSEVQDEFPSYIANSTQYAQWSALMWAALKADASCPCSKQDHTQRYYANQDSSCLYLYEVEADGGVLFDDSHDCGPEGVKVTSGMILRQVV